MQLIQQLIQGVSLGSIYGLVALGYVLIYQAWGVLNFAQGEVCAIGAFSMLELHSELGLPVWLAMPVAMIVSMAVGYLIELLSFRPLENAKGTSRLIATIGVSICVRNLLRVIFGADSFAFPSIFGDKPIEIGGLIVVPQNLWNTAFGFGLVILLNLFLRHTRVGKSMRATAQDKEAARLMGINVRRSLTNTFVMASAIGAIGGMLLAPVYLFNSNLGSVIGTKGYASAVLGGLDYASGAMVGGIILGIAECLAVALGSSAYQSVIAYIVLFLVLILKQSGIMSRKKGVEKV
ncbi:MAG: branched-chain amino acid ABC transporter permease [Clostridiales bacterium]|nr:branched-chain amino acid ABC transporter permease [Clostridiales bacterium]